MDIILPKNISISRNIDSAIWQVLKAKDSVIDIDLTNVEFLYPDGIIMLLTLSKLIHEKTNQRSSWKNTQEKVYAYLERMDIADIAFFSIEVLRKKKRLIFYRSDRPSNNLIEMRVIKNPKESSEVVRSVKDIIYNWFPERVGKADSYIRQIKQFIMHIAGNSLEHSSRKGTGTCYFMLQKYEHAQGTRIYVAFGDTGIGIRNSLKTANSWIKDNDALAIKKAFFEGLSSRSDHSGGLGFMHIREILSEYGGEIVIRSGMAAMKYNRSMRDPEIIKFKQSLPGTQTLFTIK